MRPIAVAGLLTLLTATAFANPVEAVRAEAVRGEQLWTHAGIRDYVISVNFSSFVLPEGCFSQKFKVVNGRSFSLARPKCRSRSYKADSVSALYRIIRKNLQGSDGESEASIEVDPTYGYPRKFYAGIKNMYDAYISFEVVGFAPGKSEF
jgi:hypothetical protein